MKVKGISQKAEEIAASLLKFAKLTRLKFEQTKDCPAGCDHWLKDDCKVVDE